MLHGQFTTLSFNLMKGKKVIFFYSLKGFLFLIALSLCFTGMSASYLFRETATLTFSRETATLTVHLRVFQRTAILTVHLRFFQRNCNFSSVILTLKYNVKLWLPFYCGHFQFEDLYLFLL